MLQRTSREQDIESLAEAVAVEYCPKGSVKPAIILAEKLITFSSNDYGEAFDGMLECQRGRFHVYLNYRRCGDPDQPRARFTLAHELGHYFIDEHRQALLTGQAQSHQSKADYESGNPIEREADLFAASLLMPRERFQREARKMPSGLEGIVALSREFGTSLTSTAIRFVALDITPCAVVKWNPTGFGWKWIAPSLFDSGYRATYKDLDRIPIDSATGQVFSGSDAGPIGFFKRGSTAQAWFPYIGPGTKGNIILIEEAMSLGQYGALTLLRPDKF